MIFSVTEREVIKRCERRWGLSSENMLYLEPIQNAPALSLGSLVQASLSEWTENPEIDPVEFYVNLSKEHLENVVLSYKAHHGFEVSDVELEPLYTAIILGNSMVENYVQYYTTPLPFGYRAVKTEQRAIIDIPNTEHLECNDCNWIPLDLGFKGEYLRCPKCNSTNIEVQYHKLRGTMDTLVQDNHGKYFILERKTYSQRPNPEKLQHDDQQLGYLWIMRELFGRERVGGVLYDGLWKRDATAKRSLEELFYRHVFTRPHAELDEFARLLPREAINLGECKQLSLEQLTINRPWTGCWDCGFDRLCSAISRGEDADYVRQEFYTRRSEPETTQED